jgi:hypothetical protein
MPFLSRSGPDCGRSRFRIDAGRTPDQDRLDDWCRRTGRDPATIERSVGGISAASLPDMDAYVDVGVTHLIMPAGGPDWDLSLLPKLVEWRERHS